VDHLPTTELPAGRRLRGNAEVQGVGKFVRRSSVLLLLLHGVYCTVFGLFAGAAGFPVSLPVSLLPLLAFVAPAPATNLVTLEKGCDLLPHPRATSLSPSPLPFRSDQMEAALFRATTFAVSGLTLRPGRGGH